MKTIRFNADYNEGGAVYRAGDTCELTEQTRRFVDLNLAEVIADETPATAPVKTTSAEPEESGH